MVTDPKVLGVLAEYRKRMEAEDALRKRVSRQEWLSRLDEFLLEVGEAVATLLNIFVREAGLTSPRRARCPAMLSGTGKVFGQVSDR